MEKNTFKNKKRHLEILIKSWTEQANRGCLTAKGIDYLDGLRRGYVILFGENELKNLFK